MPGSGALVTHEQQRGNVVASRFACPQCQSGIGVPRRVTTKGFFSVVIHVACQLCGHEWDIVRAMKAGVATFDRDEPAA